MEAATVFASQFLSARGLSMFKSILVALDGSAAANAGFKSALQLASDQHADLVVLHVIDDAAMAINVAGGYLPASYVDTLYDSLRKNGDAILAKAEATARTAGVKITPVLAESRGQTVARAILRQARKSKADVIVLGTHGRRGVWRMLMGSDAEAVLREASVPVVLVRRSDHQRRATARKRVSSPATAAKKAAEKQASP
jgi:nucleotide-binding universal stress UspA family protein